MIDRAKLFAALRKRESGVFGTSLTKGQVEGIERILDETGDMEVEKLAYILATAYHETGRTMQPVREAFAKSDEQAIARLENAWKKGKLKWVKTPYWRPDADGKAWFGRGYVQITHKANYQRLSPIAGVDLVADPDMALDPRIAAKILVCGMAGGLFTGKSLADYLPGDYVGARKIVNGTDRAKTIAGYARSFEKALRASYTPEPLVLVERAEKEPSAAPEPAPRPVTTSPKGIEAIIKAIIDLIVKIITSMKGKRK